MNTASALRVWTLSTAGGQVSKDGGFEAIQFKLAPNMIVALSAPNLAKNAPPQMPKRQPVRGWRVCRSKARPTGGTDAGPNP